MRVMLFAALCLLLARPVAAVTFISDWGTVIGTSDETYVLAGDLVEPGGSQGTNDSAIRVAPGTRNITIDGAGFLIDGRDLAGTADFDAGIVMLGKADSVIADVRVHDLRFTDLSNGVFGANHLCNVMVEDCEFSGCVNFSAVEFVTRELSPEFLAGPLSWITVRDNWIHGSEGIPIKLINYASAGGAPQVAMTHVDLIGNVIHGNRKSANTPENWNAAVTLRHGATDVRIWDNVVLGNDDLSGVFIGSNDVAGDVFDQVSVRGNQLGGNAGNIRSPGNVTASGMTLNKVTTTAGDFSTWEVTGNAFYQNELAGIDFITGSSSPPSLPTSGNWWGEDGVLSGTYGNGANNATDASPLDLADGVIARPDFGASDRALSDVDGYVGQVVLVNQNDGAPGIRGFDIDYDFAAFLSLAVTVEGSYFERQPFAPATTFFDVPRIGGSGNQRTASGAILGGTAGATGNGALFLTVLRAAAADLAPADDYLIDGATLRDPGNLPVPVLGTDGADRRVDDSDPLATIGPPAAGTCFNTATADLSVVISDDVALEDTFWRFYRLGLEPGCWTPLERDAAGTAYGGPNPVTASFLDGDGDYRFELCVTDDAGNRTRAELLITSDTSPPADFAGTTGAVAVPGPGTPAVEEVEYSWSGSFEAGGDLRLRVLPYGGATAYYAHPEYDDDGGGPNPHFPASSEGIEVDLPDVASGSVVLPYTVAERSYYYYTLYVVDCATNASPGVAPAVQANALSYYLGDWDSNVPPPCSGSPDFSGGNGEVDFCDLIGLSLAFGTVEGDVDYDAHADIGPTTPGPGVLDLPQTDDVIDFEDLILFAIDFGNVAPLAGDVALGGGPGSSGAAPASAGGGERVRAALELGQPVADGERLAVPLRLAGNLRAVKGIEAVIEFGGLEYLGIEADPALGEGTFLRGRAARPAGRVTVSAAVLGAGRVFAGSGTIAWLEFRRSGDGALRLALEHAKLRDAANRNAGGAASPAAVGDGNDGGGRVPAAVAARTGLLPTMPNPFNPSAEVGFVLAARGHALLRVFDAAGRLLRTLADGEQAAGEHRLTWDGRAAGGAPLATGIYLLELRAGAVRDVQKLVLLK